MQLKMFLIKTSEKLIFRAFKHMFDGTRNIRTVLPDSQAVAQSIFWIVNPIQTHEEYMIGNPNSLFKMD